MGRALTAVVLLGVSANVSAATFVVNTTLDAVDTSPGDGVCETVEPGQCTLRAAIQEANALAGRDRVDLPAGHYRITIPGTSEHFGATADIDIRDDLDLIGAGVGLSIVDANRLGRSFQLFDQADVLIEGLTVQGGFLAVEGIDNEGIGAGIRVDSASLTVRGARIFSNVATFSGDGGGIHCGFDCVLVVEDTSFESNLADFRGGAIRVGNGDLTLRNSRFFDNRASSGGALFLAGVTAVIEDSTFEENLSYGSDLSGAAISTNFGGFLRIDRSTFLGNRLFIGSGAGAILNRSVTLEINNSTISGNTVPFGSGAGGLMARSSQVMIHSTTFTENNSTFGADNVASSESMPATILFQNTILDSDFIGDNCIGNAADFTSLGFNISSDATCELDQLSDQPNTDAQLLALADNGGATLTHALALSSPALDAGDPAGCRDALGIFLESDQRGRPRIAASSPAAVPRCDIGAYEFILDADDDGIEDSTDNCPYAANPDQADRGGIGAGSEPDQIGDACQCGDVNSDGIVTLTDGVIISQALIDSTVLPNTVNLDRCDVGASSDCSITDAVIVLSAILPDPPVAIIQQCVPALP